MTKHEKPQKDFGYFVVQLQFNRQPSSDPVIVRAKSLRQVIELTEVSIEKIHVITMDDTHDQTS
jgi:hypothetical protein